MTKPMLISFKAEHMLAFLDRDSSVLEEMRFAMQKERGGPAFTATLDGKVIGCAGIIKMWPGVGYAWVVFGKDIECYSIWFTRTIRAILRDIVRALELHRVEAVVYRDNKRNLRWIQSLGFRQENYFATKYTQDKRDVVRFEYIS